MSRGDSAHRARLQHKHFELALHNFRPGYFFATGGVRAKQALAEAARRGSHDGTEPGGGGDGGAITVASDGSKPVGHKDSSKNAQPQDSSGSQVAAVIGDDKPLAAEQAGSAERKASQSLGNGHSIPVPLPRERPPPCHKPGPPCVHGSA